MNIIFVCTGNTCRSPMAEGFMNKIVSDRLLDVLALSRGLMVIPGSKVSPNSVDAMKEYNIDISNHVPKGITQSEIQNADLILTMTSSHCDALKSAFSSYSSKIFSLGSYVGMGDIPDPYGADIDEYKKCAAKIKDMIELLCDMI